MESKSINTQNENPSLGTLHKKSIRLSLIALGLVLLPVPILLISSLIRGVSAFPFFFIVVTPIFGLIIGVVSLSRGKGQIGLAGKIISIVAIAIPIAAVAFILVVFIGVATGVISLM